LAIDVGVVRRAVAERSGMQKMKFWRAVIFLVAVVAIALVSMTAGAQQPVAKESAAAATSSTSNETAAGKENNSGEETVTPEQTAFAAKVAEATQAEDVAKMRALIPPTTLKCFKGGKEKFLDEWLEKQISYGIAKDYQISVSRIPRDMAKPSKMATYPIPRTHLMEFKYSAAGNEIAVSQEIGTEGGQWYLIPPCPTAARMKQFMRKEKIHAIARNRAEHAYAELKEPVKSQLLALIAKHDDAGAMRLCRNSLHLDDQTADALITKLSGNKAD
jgi:hypothetical protein